MLIHFTFQFDKDDYANLERYLQPSVRYKPIDGDKYTDELMDIFITSENGGVSDAECIRQRQ